MTQDAPLDQKADWRCAKCDCREFARMDTRLPDTSFGPGDFVRCVNCKDVSFFPDALSRRVPASGGELKGIAWSDLDYLMSIIDAAIEDGFDPDEDGPLLDQIRAELKAPTAASPRVTAPEGWRRAFLAYVEPEDAFTQLAIALCRADGNNPDATVSVDGGPMQRHWHYYAEEARTMLLAAAPSLPEGKAEPVAYRFVPKEQTTVEDHIWRFAAMHPGDQWRVEPLFVAPVQP